MDELDYDEDFEFHDELADWDDSDLTPQEQQAIQNIAFEIEQDAGARQLKAFRDQQDILKSRGIKGAFRSNAMPKKEIGKPAWAPKSIKDYSKKKREKTRMHYPNYPAPQPQQQQQQRYPKVLGYDGPFRDGASGQILYVNRSTRQRIFYSDIYNMLSSGQLHIDVGQQSPYPPAPQNPYPQQPGYPAPQQTPNYNANYDQNLIQNPGGPAPSYPVETATTSTRDAWDTHTETKPPLPKPAARPENPVQNIPRPPGSLKVLPETLFVKGMSVGESVKLAHFKDKHVALPFEDERGNRVTVLIMEDTTLDRSKHFQPEYGKSAFNVSEAVQQTPNPSIKDMPIVMPDKKDHKHMVANIDDAVTIARRKALVAGCKSSMVMVERQTTLGQLPPDFDISFESELTDPGERFEELIRNSQELKGLAPAAYHALNRILLDTANEILLYLMGLDLVMEYDYMEELAELLQILGEMSSDDRDLPGTYADMMAKIVNNNYEFSNGTMTVNGVEDSKPETIDVLVCWERCAVLQANTGEMGMRIAPGTLDDRIMPDIYNFVVSAQSALQRKDSDVSCLYIAGPETGLIRVLTAPGVDPTHAKHAITHVLK